MKRFAQAFYCKFSKCRKKPRTKKNDSVCEVTGRLKMLMINVFICVSDPETLNESTQVVP